MNEDKIVEYLARMCFIIIVGVVVAVLLGMCSCTRTVYVPKVTVEHDSIYIATHTRDSVYLRDSIYIREKGDTTVLERWRTQYVERLRVDTTTVTVSDTIREPYPVEKPLTGAQRTWINVGKGCTIIGGMVAVVFFGYAFRRYKYGY